MPTQFAIVTGAGSGVGKAVTLALLREGYTVALAGRRPEPLQQVIAEAALPADRTLAISTDVANPDSVTNSIRPCPADVRPPRPALQQRRHQHPQYPAR